jgi:hypothetical protein
MLRQVRAHVKRNEYEKAMEWRTDYISRRGEARRDSQFVWWTGEYLPCRGSVESARHDARMQHGQQTSEGHGDEKCRWHGVGESGSGLRHTHARVPEPYAAHGRRCPAAIYGAKEPGKPTTCHVYVSEQARWFMLDDP